MFNYKRYLLSNKINYVVTASKITVIKKNDNVFYTLKNNLLRKIENTNKSKGYILAFLYADKSLIEKDVYTKYQKIGVRSFICSIRYACIFNINCFTKIIKQNKRKKKIYNCFNFLKHLLIFNQILQYQWYEQLFNLYYFL